MELENIYYQYLEEKSPLPTNLNMNHYFLNKSWPHSLAVECSAVISTLFKFYKNKVFEETEWSPVQIRLGPHHIS
jgi:hypothetical protein